MKNRISKRNGLKEISFSAREGLSSKRNITRGYTTWKRGILR
jgi:hypothetical protein